MGFLLFLSIILSLVCVHHCQVLEATALNVNVAFPTRSSSSRATVAGEVLFDRDWPGGLLLGRSVDSGVAPVTKQMTMRRDETFDRTLK